jgi:ABC-type amino acid transport substrate-binding protein
MRKQIFADGEPNLFRQYFDSEPVVRLDSLKGNEIYSVISSRRDLEGKILGEIYNTVYIETWKITEDGKILYSNLITANYNNLKKSRTDFKNIYAHSYHP